MTRNGLGHGLNDLAKEYGRDSLDSINFLFTTSSDTESRPTKSHEPKSVLDLADVLEILEDALDVAEAENATHTAALLRRKIKKLQ